MSAEVARLFVTVDANTKPLQAGLLGVDKRAKATGASLGKLGGILGAGFIGAKVLNEVKSFDKAMRNVNSIAQLSEGRFKTLSRSVLDLAGKTAQAPATLAQGLYDLESSGFNASQSMLILKSTAKAASAGLTDTAVSTKAVAAVLNAYHLKASAAAQVSDDLFQTVNLGVLSFEDLAQNIGDVLPFATNLGVSLKDLGAATSTLTKQGVPASETMTRIKGAMVALIKPTDDMQKVLKALGVQTGEELIRKTGSLQGALQALNTKVGGSKQALAQLFPDVRGLGGAFGLTGKNAAAANKDLEGFKNTAGATDKVLKQQKKSLDYQWRQFKAELAATVDVYGTQLIPVLNTSLKIIKASAPAIIAAAGAWAIYKTAALTQIAIVKAAELGLFGVGMKTRMAAEAGVAGSAAGKTFASKAGLAAAAGFAGWEIGTMMRKHVKWHPLVIAGNFAGKMLGKAIWNGAEEVLSIPTAGFSRAIRNATLIALGQTKNQFNDPASAPGSAFGPKGTGKLSGAGVYHAAARRAARAAGIDVNTFLRQIQQESGFDPNAKSGAGALGIAQFMPGTAKGLGVDPRDPMASLKAAAKLMASYVKKYGSWYDALVAYNAGPGKVGSKSLPKETRDYINAILGGGRGDSGLNLDPMKLGGKDSKKNKNLMKAIRDIAKKRGTNQTVAGIAYDVQQLFGVTPGVGKIGHPKYTKSGNISDHFYGNAIDIPAVGAENVRIAKWLKKTFGKQIKQLIYSGNDSAATGYHGDHVHLAVKNNPGLMARILRLAGQGDRGGLPFSGIFPKGKKENNRGKIKDLTNKDFLDFIEGRINHFDLMVQAGLMSATKAAMKKRAVIASRLPYLTGDAQLQALIMLRGLPAPKVPLTAAQKTWTGGGGGRDQLATAFGLLNPGWSNPRNKGIGGGSLTDPWLPNANNPWLQGALSKVGLLKGAGEISDTDANDAVKRILEKALPLATGDDALAIKGLLHDIANNTLDTANSARASGIGTADFLGGLSGPAAAAVMAAIAPYGIDQLPGGGTLSQLVGHPGAAKDLAQKDIDELMREVNSGQLTFAQAWPQIQNDLGVIAAATKQTAENTQQQIDALKEDAERAKRAQATTSAEFSAFLDWWHSESSKRSGTQIAARGLGGSYGAARRS